MTSIINEIPRSRPGRSRTGDGSMRRGASDGGSPAPSQGGRNLGDVAGSTGSARSGNDTQEPASTLLREELGVNSLEDQNETISERGGDKESSQSNNTPPPAARKAPAQKQTDGKVNQKTTSKTNGLKIASLNIQGKNDSSKNSKFKTLRLVTTKKKIAILALQETRMDEPTALKTGSELPRLELVNSGNSTSKEGVAFLINKDQMHKDASWTSTELIVGRALQLDLVWKEETLTIVNVYVPNNPKEKIEFLKALEAKLKPLKGKSLLMVGDWNMVPDAIDRLPHSKDKNRIVEPFQKLWADLDLVDGWRETNPTEKRYTHTHHYKDRNNRSQVSMGRIDRIYINKAIHQRAIRWEIEEVGDFSDHDLTGVEIIAANQPFIGDGLKKIPVDLIDHPYFRKEAEGLMKKALNECRTSAIGRTKENNPQKVWKRIKEELLEASEKARRKRKRDLHKKERALQAEIKELTRRAINQKDDDRTSTLKKLSDSKQRLKAFRRKQLDEMREKAIVNFAEQGERCTKYWFALNKEKAARDPIYALQRKDGSLATETKEMAEIARSYHEELQEEQKTSPERERATERLTAKIKKKLSEEHKNMLSQQTTYAEIESALRKTKNGKTPGIDGIPFEFYKKWRKPRTKDDQPAPYDAVETLLIVINDVESNGIDEDCKEWNTGTMALVYKKKDRTRVENYRPVTLINTDYKVFTKSIAIKLGEVAPSIIHPNQSGFIPGRSLFDAARTAQATADYCKANGLNGAIIALDQEKAYDKIAHDYLWKVLEAFDFPLSFIAKIEALYKNAVTRVVVNNYYSDPFSVARGVRQGDPMSCILYDLAIEPLGEMIRDSRLRGIPVPRKQENLKVSMFADDTLVYFSEKDKLDRLYKTLDTFCLASTARFNVGKTEILPVGTDTYRKTVLETRRLGPHRSNKIEPTTRIVEDGESLRVLGSWVGNDASIEIQWNGILEKQKRIMETWSSQRPSLRGKELLLKALVQSRASFLATVNGMPKDVEITMEKQMKDFVWDNKARALANWDIMSQDRKSGGLAMPNIRLRNQAIEIMWLKRFLAPESDRPTWALLYEDIIFKSIQKKPIIDPEARISWILQSWHELDSPKADIPPHLKRMLKIGRKYNVGLNGLKFDLTSKMEMPLWHHPAVKNNYYWNKKSSKCLRRTHKITSVGDALAEWRDYQERPGCASPMACKKMLDSLLSLLPGKFNPLITTPRKDDLDHTKRRIEKYKNLSVKEDTVTFNPDVTEKSDPLNAIRIFQKKPSYKKRRTKTAQLEKKPLWRSRNKKTEKLTIFTDGSSTRNGYKNSQAGAGVHVEGHPSLDLGIRLEGEIQTNQRAELVAILVAAGLDRHAEMEVRSDSRYCTDGIIERLKDMEDKDFVDVENADVWRRLAYVLRRRTDKTSFLWIKGHSGIEGNEIADTIADAAAKRTAPDHVKLKTKERATQSGARLQALDQRTAYRLLLREEAKKKPHSPALRHRLKKITNEILSQTGREPFEASIWTNTWNLRVPNQVKGFLWRMIHGRLRCGLFFKNIPQMQDLQFCECGEVETPGHIITKCARSGQDRIWKEIGRIMKETFRLNTPEMGEETIMGIASLKLPIGKGEKPKEHASRAYQTMAALASWTIWKLRNQRKFQETKPQKSDYLNRWKADMLRLIKIEFELARRRDTGEKVKHLEMFNKTWCGGPLAKVTEGKLECKYLEDR